MNIQPPIQVPKGIRYLGNWPGFSLPSHPSILNKQLTGCGFTEWVISNPAPMILISPRKVLLENKIEQHNQFTILENGIKIEIPTARMIYYARSNEPDLGVDKDLSGSKRKSTTSSLGSLKVSSVDFAKFANNLRQALMDFGPRVPKICCTYDSFRKVRDILENYYGPENFNNQWTVVVDEFQSILNDVFFKPNTEMEFLQALQGLQRVCFVSATPSLEEDLDQIPEFQNLPYYILDWESLDPGRIVKPKVIAKPCDNINKIAKRYISAYQEGKFDRRLQYDLQGNPFQVIESKELVIYINSVRNICDIIKQNQLTPQNTNVICAKTPENAKKIREAFRTSLKKIHKDKFPKELLPLESEIIGSVPVPDRETGVCQNKMFTLCTKTVYLGADFYSKCARSLILSDANVKSLAVDISLDLVQIMGRQRDLENPWKYEADLWFKSDLEGKTQEEFEAEINKKIRTTEALLRTFERALEGDKNEVANNYLKVAISDNYADDYVAVNRHVGGILVPQKNILAIVAERRAFKIQSVDYKDRFSMFAAIENSIGQGASKESKIINDWLEKIESTQFRDKMRNICTSLDEIDNDSLRLLLINHIPEPFRTYYTTLGADYVKYVSYQKSKLDQAMKSGSLVILEEELEKVVNQKFKVGDRYSKSDIKFKLNEIYSEIGISKTAKATDLEKWFDLRRISIASGTGRANGFLLSQKKL